MNTIYKNTDTTNLINEQPIKALNHLGSLLLAAPTRKYDCTDNTFILHDMGILMALWLYHIAILFIRINNFVRNL